MTTAGTFTIIFEPFFDAGFIKTMATWELRGRSILCQLFQTNVAFAVFNLLSLWELLNKLWIARSRSRLSRLISSKPWLTKNLSNYDRNRWNSLMLLRMLLVCVLLLLLSWLLGISKRLILCLWTMDYLRTFLNRD